MRNTGIFQVVDFLNRLLAAAPVELTRLIEYRVELRDAALAEAVDRSGAVVLADEQDTYLLGLLGVLNGAFAGSEWPRIAAYCPKAAPQIPERFFVMDAGGKEVKPPESED